jgi:hypothetical protein
MSNNNSNAIGITKSAEVYEVEVINFTPEITDTNCFFECTGTNQIVTLPVASSVVTGYANTFYNNGLTELTLSGAINGGSSLSIAIGNTARIISNGTEYKIDYHTAPFPPAAEHSFAEIYWDEQPNTTYTTFAGVDTPTLALGTTSTQTAVINFTAGNNALTYTGPDNTIINFLATVSVITEESSISGYMAVNGGAGAHTKSPTQWAFPSTPVILPIIVQGSWMADSGDTVSLYLENNTSTQNALVVYGTIKVWS